MRTLLDISAITVLLYIIALFAVSEIDREHCESYGTKYHSTDMYFNGFCEVSGIKVPAELIGD